MAENTTNLTNLVVTDLTVGGSLSIADDLVIVDDFTLGLASTIIIGTQANTAGSGHPLTASDARTICAFNDDGGANIGDSVRGIQSRMLLTVDQSGGTIRALQGQLKVVDTFGVGTGIYTAVQGYVELAGTHAIGTGATASCFDASTEIGTALTVDSGAEYFGIHVETTGAGTITNNGTCAGIGITKAVGAASWPYAIYSSGAARKAAYYNVDLGTVTSEEHAWSLATTGTLSSGDSIVGANIVLTTGGTAGTWASALYAKTIQGTTKNVNGYLCAAEFELATGSVTGALSDNFVVVLNYNNADPDLTSVSHHGYFQLHSYGATDPLYLFDIQDFSIGAKSDTDMLTTFADGAHISHAIHIKIGTTPYWILCSSVAPSGT